MSIVGRDWDLGSVLYTLAPSCFQFVPHIHGSRVSQRLRLNLNIEFQVLFLYFSSFWVSPSFSSTFGCSRLFLHVSLVRKVIELLADCPPPVPLLPILPLQLLLEKKKTGKNKSFRERQQETSHLLQMLILLQNLFSLVGSPKPSNRFSPWYMYLLFTGELVC